MEINNCFHISLDSETYRHLFEPSSDCDWIPSDIDEWTLKGVDFYHSSACFPRYEFLVKGDDVQGFFRTLLGAFRKHLEKIETDVHQYQVHLPYVDTEKDDEGEYWELCTDIEAYWGGDSTEELLSIQSSIQALIKDIENNLK